MDEKIDGRSNRKRSSRSKFGLPKNREQSLAQKLRFKNPEARARNAQVCADMRARKFANPDHKKHSRFGVFDGMRREQSDQIWAEARAKADRTIQKMQEKGILAQDEDPRAVEALHTAVTVLRTPINQQFALAAARLILDFTKSKPVAKHEHTINAAEQWLAAVSDDDTLPEAPEDEDATT